MSDTKISALPPVVGATDSDEFAIARGGVSNKITRGQVIAGLDPAGTASAAVAAHEAGTDVHSIAAVTGLQTALNNTDPAGSAQTVQDNLDTHTGTVTGNPHQVTAAETGADPSGTAASAVSTHEASADVHTIAASVGLQDALDGKEPSGTADAAVSAHEALTDGSAHTISGTSGLQTALNAKGQVDSVVAGTNVTVDASDPANPIVSSTAAGGGGATYTDVGLVADASTTELPAGQVRADYQVTGPASGAFTLNITHSFTGTDAGACYIDLDNASGASLTVQVNGTPIPAATWTDTPDWTGHIRIEVYVAEGVITNATWVLVEGA